MTALILVLAITLPSTVSLSWDPVLARDATSRVSCTLAESRRNGIIFWRVRRRSRCRVRRKRVELDPALCPRCVVSFYFEPDRHGQTLESDTCVRGDKPKERRRMKRSRVIKHSPGSS